jgi:negative regulator of sigma E activity
MDSFFARNRLSAYLDRTLPKAEAEAVSEAIARDIALSADVQAMHKVLSLMHEVGKVPAPTGFHARTMATIAAQPVPGSQVAWLQRRLARIPTELVALAGAALIIVVALNRSTPDDGTPNPAPTDSPTELQAAAATVPETPTAGNPATASVEPPADPSTTTPSTTAETPKSTKPASKTPTRPQTPVPTSLPYDPSSPLAYRILSGGDQILYDLATLADETNGRLTDVHGRLFTPYSLSEGVSFASVYLVVSHADAASTHARLLKRSGMEPYPLEGPQPPLNDGETVFMIEAQL